MSFIYVGLRIKSYTDGLTVDQEHYIESINTIHITKERLLEKDGQLNKRSLLTLELWVANSAGYQHMQDQI